MSDTTYALVILVERFLTQGTIRYTASTVTTYRDDLADFVAFCGVHDVVEFGRTPYKRGGQLPWVARRWTPREPGRRLPRGAAGPGVDPDRGASGRRGGAARPMVAGRAVPGPGRRRSGTGPPGSPRRSREAIRSPDGRGEGSERSRSTVRRSTSKASRQAAQTVMCARARVAASGAIDPSASALTRSPRQGPCETRWIIASPARNRRPPPRP